MICRAHALYAFSWVAPHKNLTHFIHGLNAALCCSPIRASSPLPLTVTAVLSTLFPSQLSEASCNPSLLQTYKVFQQAHCCCHAAAVQPTPANSLQLKQFSIMQTIHRCIYGHIKHKAALSQTQNTHRLVGTKALHGSNAWCSTRTRLLAASSSSNVDSSSMPAPSRSISSGSTFLSEQVTRTVFGCSAELMFAGLGCAGLRAFCTAAFR